MKMKEFKKALAKAGEPPSTDMDKFSKGYERYEPVIDGHKEKVRQRNNDGEQANAPKSPAMGLILESEGHRSLFIDPNPDADKVTFMTYNGHTQDINIEICTRERANEIWGIRREEGYTRVEAGEAYDFFWELLSDFSSVRISAPPTPEAPETEREVMMKVQAVGDIPFMDILQATGYTADQIRIAQGRIKKNELSKMQSLARRFPGNAKISSITQKKLGQVIINAKAQSGPKTVSPQVAEKIKSLNAKNNASNSTEPGLTMFGKLCRAFYKIGTKDVGGY